MTHGDIYEKAYKLKVFQIWELIDELSKDWGFLGRKFIKDRVMGWISTQLRYKTLLKVSSEPPVFSFPEFVENWERYLRKRTCPVCGKTFLPTKKTQELCSEECKKEHYREYHKRRRKNLGMKLGSKRRWTKEEERLLLRLKSEGKSWDEIARILGRQKEGVKDKFKRLKKEGVVK